MPQYPVGQIPLQPMYQQTPTPPSQEFLQPPPQRSRLQQLQQSLENCPGRVCEAFERIPSHLRTIPHDLLGVVGAFLTRFSHRLVRLLPSNHFHMLRKIASSFTPF
ncbi:hypothetical protein M434DRAFT_38072 [Hypoxylon sp. CO27-5]|nr:hypothetical protein M434DRAFT_38072 [Hypoxylon sp. CO27-5]